MKDFKIAAASKDGERVDTHFGFADVYRIIKVNMEDKNATARHFLIPSLLLTVLYIEVLVLSTSVKDIALVGYDKGIKAVSTCNINDSWCRKLQDVAFESVIAYGCKTVVVIGTARHQVPVFWCPEPGLRILFWS